MILFIVPSCHLRGRTERNHKEPDNTHCLSWDSNLVSVECKSEERYVSLGACCFVILSHGPPILVRYVDFIVIP